MASMRRVLSPINIYHASSRGVGQILIYEDDEDRREFISILQKHAEKRDVIILAWCLMSNHYHILFSGELAEVSKVMNIVNSLYARYFNERHGRKGHLFEGRYWSGAVDTEEQMLEVIRYIHLNPQRAGIAPADKYIWSSYHTYINGERGLADPSIALSIFGSIDSFKAFHAQINSSPGSGRPKHWIRMSDENAIRTACSKLGIASLKDLLKLPLSKRNQGIRRLKRFGFSCSQLQRITGLGKNTISRI